MTTNLTKANEGVISLTNPTIAGATMSGVLNLVTGSGSVAPLKFTAGTNLVTPSSGVMEFDGTELYITNTARRSLLYKDGSNAPGTGTSFNISITGNATYATYANTKSGGSGSGSELVSNTGTWGINITGRGYPRRSDGNDLNFYWSGQSGQPTWLWGGTDGTNMYVYNPSNFSVSSATNATNATYGRYAYNNGAYSGSGWVEPSDLGVRYASSAGNSDTVDGYHASSLLAWSNFTGVPSFASAGYCNLVPFWNVDGGGVAWFTGQNMLDWYGSGVYLGTDAASASGPIFVVSSGTINQTGTVALAIWLNYQFNSTGSTVGLTELWKVRNY